MAATADQHDSKNRILNATMRVVRSKGYAASTIDDICVEAGLTKGSFFHHFRSKEELAIAAAGHFSDMTARLFASAPYQSFEDPLERLLGYIDFRVAILKGELPEFTCLLGTMVQETYQTHPAIRQACERGIMVNAAEIGKIVSMAKKKYVPRAKWSPESLGVFTQTVIQGALLLAKAKNGPEVAVDSLKHLRRYIELLFSEGKKES